MQMSVSAAEPGIETAPRPFIHPLALRVMHWLNAIAIVVMIGSGWQIYNSSPLFGFSFPRQITIGGWLAAAIAWHLAFMWLLLGNGLAYVVWGLAGGHFRRNYLPLQLRLVPRQIVAALQFKLAHQLGVYNAVQRLLYAGVLLAGLVVVISGLAIWKPVQLWFFCNLLGGYFIARYVHFFAMAAIVAFICIHIALVMAVPRVLPPMILWSRKK